METKLVGQGDTPRFRFYVSVDVRRKSRGTQEVSAYLRGNNNSLLRLNARSSWTSCTQAKQNMDISGFGLISQSHAKQPLTNAEITNVKKILGQCK